MLPGWAAGHGAVVAIANAGLLIEERSLPYKRSAVSLLAGIDLLTGQVHALVKDRHRSREFIEFLKLLDAAYPSHTAIKLILDNHSAHISKETKAWLAAQPEGRFTFVFTPKHGSWLNLVEGFFSKLARSVLRHIRLASKQELKNRIMAAMDHFNRHPVVHTWSYKLDQAARYDSNLKIDELVGLGTKRMALKIASSRFASDLRHPRRREISGSGGPLSTVFERRGRVACEINPHPGGRRRQRDAPRPTSNNSPGASPARQNSSSTRTRPIAPTDRPLLVAAAWRDAEVQSRRGEVGPRRVLGGQAR